MPSGPSLNDIRNDIRQNYLADERESVGRLISELDLSAGEREKISTEAASIVQAIRETSDPTMMESFLSEYGLSTKEGVALMCLAEALLRVPDAETVDALISDKISPADWGQHLGHSSSSLVNASTWALLLTGRVLKEEDNTLVGSLRGMVRRLGEPVVRTAVGQAMKELGRQFVLGRTIEEAVSNGQDMEADGYTYSFDMLGEAARTEDDAKRYHLAYSNAITDLAKSCTSPDIRENPGISVKLSALHPRYEYGQKDRVMDELSPRATSLALLAKSANMGFNIDAEEADRLDLSLDIIEEMLSDPALASWDGFGIVVQAYGPRAYHVLDWLYTLAKKHDRRIMIRLVKGAYWDTEIKRAQVMGLPGYPVFTRKCNTDISFLACAQKLLGMTDHIYPQFATHNAHTCAAVFHMAQEMDVPIDAFELQRLHGMGETLHQAVREKWNSRCRIYAPVGAHEDLLAYLVRRLLENGANSSFVHQIVDKDVPPEEIARDPLETLTACGEEVANTLIPAPVDLFGKDRRNAKGWDLTDPTCVDELEAERAKFARTEWQAQPITAAKINLKGREALDIINPADPGDCAGKVFDATGEDALAAIAAAEPWRAASADRRAACLEAAADLYEENAAEIFAVLTREAGKTPLDAVAEVREAVDFLRFYAGEARRLDTRSEFNPRGVFVCISPWNFPLAIFTGQIAAALSAGNAVLAKPAEQTPLIACLAAQLLHRAGVPVSALQLLPGDGTSVGAELVGSPDIDGVCFTGSTETAQIINKAMSGNAAPNAPLIAETGGLNAMIVDSTALAEQAVQDILIGSFQSAGQRCSALRLLYVQNDIKDRFLTMLYGAMDELAVGNPWDLATDVGPVIDDDAQRSIADYCQAMTSKGRLLKTLEVPEEGRFVAPTVFSVSGIEELEKEVFGPVLHVATFEADEIDQVVEAIGNSGYGLTFGLHTRVDARVQQIVDNVRVGNIYVNRNQIGAVVGSQPFGGEGLSGTGPKAGGPHYVQKFAAGNDNVSGTVSEPVAANSISKEVLEAALKELDPSSWLANKRRVRALLSYAGDRLAKSFISALKSYPTEAADLPGPTGESNRLSLHARGRVICALTDESVCEMQAVAALTSGNAVLIAGDAQPEWVAKLQNLGCPVGFLAGDLEPGSLEEAAGFAVVAIAPVDPNARAFRVALSKRKGPILPLVISADDIYTFALERHLCVDTTAAGGNASLMALGS